MKVIQVAIKWTIKLGVKFPPHVSHSSLILCVVEVGVSGRKHGVQRLESMLPTAILMLCKISETVTEIRKSVTNGFTDGQTDRRHPSKPPVQNCQKNLIFCDFLIPLSHKIHTKPRCDKIYGWSTFIYFPVSQRVSGSPASDPQQSDLRYPRNILVSHIFWLVASLPCGEGGSEGRGRGGGASLEDVWGWEIQ